ncbi:MAG: MBL fold metallo-hydrolase [Clostridia bacterium]|nr:MBL fold metallo-hydrolase [Clostridia bacterium]
MATVLTPWEGTFPPFRMFGNLYFVGTEPASVHIVDTGDGLCMLDTGYQHSLYVVLDNMYRMGLNPHDVKLILLTHGHIDHFGAAKALRELTGAKIALGAADREYATGELDLSYAKELDMTYTETFDPDILLSDGDRITLGNTTFTAIGTPGHTPGAMSYLFPVTAGKETLMAGLHGGMGINTMCREFLDAYGLSYDCRDKFRAAMDRLKEIHVDIFLGNHMQHNDTAGKYKAVMAGEKYACVKPDEWPAYAEWAKQNLRNMIERENQQ